MVLIKNFDKKRKITKKQYFMEVKDNLHYNIGSIWKRRTGEYNMGKSDLIHALNTKFLDIEFLKENGLACSGCTQNTVDFLHIKQGENTYLHEQKKGEFYIIDIKDDLSLILHYYKDSTSTISFKVVVKN